MSRIGALLGELEERELAQRVGIPHDEARMRFSLTRNTVRTYDEFGTVLGNYVNHDRATCVPDAGRLPAYKAQGKAKRLLEQEYRKKKGKDLRTAFSDAHDGTNGGLRVVLDILADALKAESVEYYMRYVFDRYVAPSSWGEQVEIIRQFIARCGIDLSASVRADQPERYARDYEELIGAYVDGLRETSSMFRRL